MGVARGPRSGLWELSNLFKDILARVGYLGVAWGFGLHFAHEVVVGLIGVI
jgi:hypothetical protein